VARPPIENRHAVRCHVRTLSQSYGDTSK